MVNLESHIKLQTNCKIKYSDRNDFFAWILKKEMPPKELSKTSGARIRNIMDNPARKTIMLACPYHDFSQKKTPKGTRKPQGQRSATLWENMETIMIEYNYSIISGKKKPLGVWHSLRGIIKEDKRTRGILS